MRVRVKEGNRYGAAVAGEILEVEAWEAERVPWCLEPVIDVEPASPVAVDDVMSVDAGPPPAPKSKRK